MLSAADRNRYSATSYGVFVGQAVPETLYNFTIPGHTVTEKFDSKYSDMALRDTFWPELDSDVISGLVEEDVGLSVQVKFGESRSNRFCRSTKR